MDTLLELTSAILNKVRISDIEMMGADLIDAELSNMQADRLNLCSANMSGSKLRMVRLGDSRLNGANFEKADFTNAVLRMCVLDGGRGAGACFNNARIEDSSAKGACLTGVEMRGAKLTETSFERAVLQDAALDGAEGDGIEFRGADLSRATFISVRFNDADFRGADLRGANLSKGCFRDADFRGALLDGTLFEGADCSGAIFDANEGPYAASTDKEKNDEPANILASLLSNTLIKLPGVFAGNEDFIKDITDRLQQASDAYKTTSKHSPEEWKEWTESFLALAKDKETLDLETIIEALYKGPIKLQNQSLLGAVSKEEMLDRMRALNKLLNSSTNEPPEAWKPILEPLMKKLKSGEGIDFKTIQGLFSKLLQDLPSK